MKLFKILTTVILASIASATSAQSTAPLTFGDSNTDEDNWNYLMHFKLWGTEGISFGNKPTFSDTLGWVGTATGNLESLGNGGSIGGPIIVGGSITNKSTESIKITTGPIRSDGTITAQVGNGIVKCSSTASTSSCSTDKVPEIRPTLKIPTLPESIPWSPGITVSSHEQKVINVDTTCPETGVCDLFYESINLGEDGTLIVSMPESGRTTRIFTKSLNMVTHPQIVIRYTNKGNLELSDYEGNLLIYVDNDINFANTDYSTIMGTFVSTGTIELTNNITFSGQMIANNLIIGNEIGGSYFRFMPFKGPDISLSLLGNRANIFEENDTWQAVNLGLNNAAKVDVTFDYCFEFYSATGVQNTYAGYQDVAASDASHKFPICNKGESAKATIKAGDTKTEGILIKPLVDGYIEKNESLWLQINNLEGAKLASNYENGIGYKINIVSNDKSPIVSSELVVSVNEDSKHTFTSSEFKFQHALQKFASVIITSIPAKGSLTLNGTAVKVNTTIAVANLSKFTYTPAANDFGNSYTTFKYKVVGDGTGANTSVEYNATVNVIPVNDKPTAAETIFYVNELDHAVSGGPIEVKDVANERSKDTYTYKVVEKTGSDYAAFNDAFKIVKLTNDNATIEVKTGAVLDYNKKKQYVVYATVTDNAATETKVAAGSLTSEQFKITVNVTESSPPESSSSEKNETVIVKLDPLHFEIDSVAVTDKEENQSLWNRLMKYKLWGTDQVIFNKHGFKISESSGYTGTAKGDVIFNDYVHTLGGPIVSGRDLVFAKGPANKDSLIEGSIYARNLYLPDWYKADDSRFDGNICFEGTINFGMPNENSQFSDYIWTLNRFIENAHKDNDSKQKKGMVYADWNEDLPDPSAVNLDGPYKKCPDDVPRPDKDLSVPVLDETSITWEPAVDLNSSYYGEIQYIHVPPVTAVDVKNEHTWFDKFVDNIHFEGNYGKKLYILMPSRAQNADGKTGRLTRIFTKKGVNISGSANDTKIQVAYVNNTAKWNGSSWVKADGNAIDEDAITVVPDSNYAGNLLFYTNADIYWSAMNSNKESDYQGTYITTGDFTIEDHINVTGQLIAGGTLWFESEFSGDFHYVTFNKSEVSSSQSSSSSSATSSSTVKSSSSTQAMSSSWSEAIGSSNSSTLRSSSSTVVKSSSSSKTIATNSSSSRNDKASSSSYNNAKFSSSSVPSSSWSEAIGSSNSSTLRSSSSAVAKSSSSSKGIAAKSSSSRNDKASSSSYNNAKSSSSSAPSSSWSEAIGSSNSSTLRSSSSTTAKSSSSSKGIATNSSSSRNDKASSSSYNDKKSSSSSKISDGEIPDFYVRMTGAFEFEIVMDESVPSIAKKYAVMDMKGQVLTVGELNDKNAYVKVPTRGAYIVKVGLGYRRINVR